MDLVMNVTPVTLMLTMVQNVILHATGPAISLPEPIILLLVGMLMLTVGNLKRRTAALTSQARESLGRSSDR